MDEMKQVVNDALASEESVTKSVPRDEVTLSSGVVLKVRPVPPLLLNRVQMRFPKVPVPVVYNPDKERDEPNPNDPEYTEAIERNEFSKTEALLDIMIGRGTEPISIPAGMPKPQDDEWLEELEFYLQEEQDKRERPRYLAWVKFVAIQNTDDMQKLSGAVQVMMGVSEQAVADHLNSFRNQS